MRSNKPLDWLCVVALAWDEDRCLLWPFGVDRDGYGRVKYQGVEGRSHRLVFRLKYGRWPNPCALHSCDTPGCCNLKHISEGTQVENQNQKASRQRSLRGTQQHSNKLSESQVRQIRQEYRPGVYRRGSYSLAKKYGVTKRLVLLIVNRRIWRHVA